ncbi:MAG: formate dehydrogenase accessory protein FdhE [Alsobacter sp.]
MSDTEIRPDPSTIGRALPPPFVRLPDPGALFARRAARFAELAGAHPLGPYLTLMEGVARAQDALLPLLPALSSPMQGEPGIATPPEVPQDAPRGSPGLPAAAGDDAEGASERPGDADDHGPPPLSRLAWPRDPVVLHTLRGLFDALGAVSMPGEAAEALGGLRSAGDEALAGPVAAVLAEAIPAERLAEHAFVAAGLQVHAARSAAALPAARPRRVAHGLCPACQGAPVASLVVGWPGAENARYAACSLCGTLWNAVRVKCLVCEATGGISYREVAESGGAVKAECCDTCRSYVKVLHQAGHPRLDPLADDIGSVGLDLLLRDEPYRRAGFNPFLLGV